MLRRGALIFIVACTAMPAAAQQVVTDSETISRCLCLHQAMDARSEAVSSTREALDQGQAEAARLAEEVARRRPQVQVDKDADIAAFTDLLHRSDDARAQLNSQQVPAYNTAVAAYNQSLDAYNGQCSGRSFDAAALERARTNLVCPKP